MIDGIDASQVLLIVLVGLSTWTLTQVTRQGTRITRIEGKLSDSVIARIERLERQVEMHAKEISEQERICGMRHPGLQQVYDQTRNRPNPHQSSG